MTPAAPAPDGPAPGLAPAPDFTAVDQHGVDHTLSDRRGVPVLLVFFPWANTPVCSGELVALQQRLPALTAAGVSVLALSCDSRYSLRAFAEALSLTVTLLSDHWPHGEIAARYRAFDAGRGCAERVSVLVDPAGAQVWRDHVDVATARDFDAPLAALARR